MSRGIALLVFFLVGLSSLIYEITWVRQATLTFGVSIHAFSAVLVAYMGGMALGGYAIGKWADRVRRSGRLLAALLVGLAVLGCIALPLLSALTGVYSALTRSLQLENGLLLTVLRLALALLPLAPPSLLIGAAFPVMARIHSRADGKVGGDLGRMYAANTLGSVVGCLLAAVVLIRAFGVPGASFFAAGLNVLTALLAWFALDPRPEAPEAAPGGARVDEPSTPPAAVGAPSVAPRAPALPAHALRFVLVAYAVSGFVSLAYEVAWGRLMSLYVIGHMYSFSLMLAVYLAGLVAGAALASAWIRRRGASLGLFGGLEIAIGLLALLSLFVFPRLSGMKMNALFGSYSVETNILYESLLSLLTLFPATLAIGAVFPVAISLYSGEQAARLGRKVSRVAALNTVGSVVGSLLAGFVLIPRLGLQGTVTSLAFLNVAIGLAAFWIPPRTSIRPRALAAAAAGLAVVAVLLLPRPRYLGYWENLADQLLFYREGVETTVAVFGPGPRNPKFSTVNGRIEVPTDPISMRIFHLLGHVPTLLHPEARNALVLSFGNGIASGTLATHPLSRIDVVDLSAEMIQAARQVYTAENRGVADDPRVAVHIEDARNYLLQTDRTFDIISNDATHPSNSSSWVLFTDEFYRQVKSHLTPDGIFVQWLPCHSISTDEYRSILRTFLSVFPNATLWYAGGTHSMLVATPTRLTREALVAQLQARALPTQVLAELGDATDITRYWAFDTEGMRRFAGEGPVVRDATAFFLSDGRDTPSLIRTLQAATISRGE